MEDRLLSELQVLLEACRQRGVEVFVIGGFGVHAYGSLLRRTLDLDLAVAAGAWPALAEVIKAQGYQPIREMLQNEEVNAIWWDRLGLMLDEDERWTALRVVRRIRALRMGESRS